MTGPARPPCCIDYDSFVIVYLFAQLVGAITDGDVVLTTPPPARRLWS